MKKIMLGILSVCLGVAVCIAPIYASDGLSPNEEELFDRELSNAIVAGDGSAENPYIVDYNKAPNFKMHVESLAKDVILSIGSGNLGIKPYGIFDGIFTGKLSGTYNSGAVWTYTHGAPSASSDNKLWMKKIIYIPIADTANIRNLLYDEILVSVVDGCIEEIKDKSFEHALEFLINRGIQKVLAKSLLKSLGFAGNFFTPLEIISFWNVCLRYMDYDEAFMAKDGMIEAVYCTSYHGDWYQHCEEDSWVSANNVYEPGSYYGSGVVNNLGHYV